MNQSIDESTDSLLILLTINYVTIIYSLTQELNVNHRDQKNLVAAKVEIDSIKTNSKVVIG